MTSFHGSPEAIASMMGLPEERWFEKLDETSDWAVLILNPVEDLRETEAVFRTIWATAGELRAISMPRDLAGRRAETPEMSAAIGAFRAIGASLVADMIETGPPQKVDMPDDTGMSNEELRSAREKYYEAASAERAWWKDFSNARSDVRPLLIKYLTSRGVFPLEPPEPAPARRPFDMDRELKALAELERLKQLRERK